MVLHLLPWRRLPRIGCYSVDSLLYMLDFHGLNLYGTLLIFLDGHGLIRPIRLLISQKGQVLGMECSSAVSG